MRACAVTDRASRARRLRSSSCCAMRVSPAARSPPTVRWMRIADTMSRMVSESCRAANDSSTSPVRAPRESSRDIRANSSLMGAGVSRAARSMVCASDRPAPSPPASCWDAAGSCAMSRSRNRRSADVTTVAAPQMTATATSAPPADVPRSHRTTVPAAAAAERTTTRNAPGPNAMPARSSFDARRRPTAVRDTRSPPPPMVQRSGAATRRWTATVPQMAEPAAQAPATTALTAHRRCDGASDGVRRPCVEPIPEPLRIPHPPEGPTACG